MAASNKRWKEISAKFVATLAYLDEPQIVLLDHGIDAKIIGVAIEKSGYEYAFLGSEISVDQWERYQREFVDLRYLFLVPRWKRWYLFDLAKQDADSKIPLIRAEKEDYRNEEFLPHHGFFARDHSEPAPIFEAIELGQQRFLIDGTWDPSDLSLFFARINDLYSFFLGIQKFISDKTTLSQKQALLDAFTDNTLHSGFNYVNFFGDLKGLVGFGERLAMGAIQKSSPGFVDLEGRTTTLNEIMAAFNNYSAKQETLRAQYTELHGYLSKNFLLRKDGATRFDKTSPVARHVAGMNKSFASALGLDHDSIDKLTGKNALSTAKILLSYHRRMERYHLFFIEGRVKIGDPLASLNIESPL